MDTLFDKCGLRKLLGRCHWLRGRSSSVPSCWSLPPHSSSLPQSTPLLQGQKLGVVCSVFPLAPPTSPAPAKAKERVKGAKILHGSNLKGGGGWSCKPNAVQDLEKTLKRI